MKVEETKKVSVEVEEVKNIKCDICSKNLLKKNATEAKGGSLLGFKLTKENETVEIEQNETSDFCEKCYNELMSYLRTEKKAKIPSYYYNIDVLDEMDEQTTDKRH